MTPTPISASIYTDGSCNTIFLAGAWVAIILVGEEKKQISGTETGTTHNRMELTAVIKALEFIRDLYKEIYSITLYSDSQYVLGLRARKEKISALGFAGRKGRELQNADLVRKLLELMDLFTIENIKIKAHQEKDDINEFNIEADMLSRKMVRAFVKNNFT